MTPDEELAMYRALHERLAATTACSSPDGGAEAAQIEQAYAERVRLPLALAVMFYVLMRDADLHADEVTAAIDAHVRPTVGMELRFTDKERQGTAEWLAERFVRAIARMD